MCEADAVLVQLDDPGDPRPVEPVAELLGLGADGYEGGRGRFGDERDGLEHMPDRARQTLEPRTHELVELSRNRKWLCRTQRHSTVHQEARDLERVEGIPRRGVVDAPERWARQRLAHAREDEPVQGAHRERADRDPRRPLREVALERKRTWRGLEPRGDEQLDALVR